MIRATRGAALLLLLLARAANAQKPPTPRVILPPPRVNVSLTFAYQRDPGAGACPTGETFQIELAGRLGHDPFVPDPGAIPSGDLHVTVSRTPAGFEARYAWTGAPAGVLSASRYAFPGTTARDCADALAGLAVYLAIPISRLEVHHGARYAPPHKPGAPCPASRFSVWPPEWPMEPLPRPRPDPDPPPERAPRAVRIGAALWPELIASGWGSIGLALDAGLRYRALSASVELHGDPPLGSSAFPSKINVSVARVSGALNLCGHAGWFVGCALADVGRFVFPTHPNTLPASIFYGAAGVRMGLEFPVAPPRIFLRAALDLRAAIRPATYVRSDSVVFASAKLSGGLGLGLVVEFPR